MDLRTRELGHVFRDTASSYKFYWLLAILDHLPILDQPVPIEQIVRGMILRAWATVAVFRLSLGKADRLQDCVRAFQTAASLGNRASSARLDRELARWEALAGWADELGRFVPGRFLGTWFPQIARQAPYDRRGARDVAFASERAWGTEQSGPYRLGYGSLGATIELAPGWKEWLSSHQAILTGYVEHDLATYLQARNANVPGIIAKLALPRRRTLGPARNAWTWVLSQEFPEPLCDIYMLSCTEN